MSKNDAGKSFNDMMENKSAEEIERILNPSNWSYTKELMTMSNLWEEFLKGIDKVNKNMEEVNKKLDNFDKIKAKNTLQSMVHMLELSGKESFLKMNKKEIDLIFKLLEED